jgi:hypothetical protein
MYPCHFQMGRHLRTHQIPGRKSSDALVPSQAASGEPAVVNIGPAVASTARRFDPEREPLAAPDASQISYAQRVMRMRLPETKAISIPARAPPLQVPTGSPSLPSASQSA